MEFGALHWSECGAVLVMSPVSVRPDENDLVAKQTALAEILLPVIRDENLERRNHRECPWRSAKTDQMNGKRIWRKTRPKKSAGARGNRQRGLGPDVLRRLASLQLVEGGGIMRPSDNSAEPRPEVNVANRRILWRYVHDNATGRQIQ